jgi:hypothetical protein
VRNNRIRGGHVAASAASYCHDSIDIYTIRPRDHKVFLKLSLGTLKVPKCVLSSTSECVQLLVISSTI